MAQAYFPTVDEVMQILLAELPENVYPSDRADAEDESKRSISSSELRAHAYLIATLYQNLSLINQDKSIGTTTQAGLAEWERDVFNLAQDSTLDFASRQAKIVSKFRSTGGISFASIENIVSGILDPLGVEFALAPWCGVNQGAWVLDESDLEMGTYLTSMDPVLGARLDIPVLDCDLNYAASDLTEENLRDIQASAYTYELRIFGSVSDDTISTLDAILIHFEPARSQHLILNNHTGNDIVPTPDDVIEWKLDDSLLGEDTFLTAGKFTGGLTDGQKKLA